MILGVPVFSVAVVVVVFVATQLLKRRWPSSPIYLGWIVAAALTAVAWVLFPGEVSLSALSWAIVGVFGLQGGVKNVQTVMASFRQFRGRDRIDYQQHYPDVGREMADVQRRSEGD